MKIIKTYDTVNLFTEDYIRKNHIRYDSLADYVKYLGKEVMISRIEDDSFYFLDSEYNEIKAPLEVIDKNSLQNGYLSDSRYCMLYRNKDNDVVYVIARSIKELESYINEHQPKVIKIFQIAREMEVKMGVQECGIMSQENI